MNRAEQIAEELKLTFSESPYPAEFLEQYDQLECFSHSRGTETFLVREKCSGDLYVAKCFDKSACVEIHESEILLRLRHNGLPAYAASYENARVSVTVREYVAGVPLDLFVRQNRISEQQAIQICVQLCDILRYLHDQENPVIHRDVKPQNVIVRPDGTVALIDFDIARRYSDGAETDTQFFGTRTYAPPEQYGFSQTDCRTDIYSLGVLLRFLLTGNEKELPDKPLSKHMKRIVGRCTAFAPKDRFANAAAVKNALLRADGRRREKIALSLSFAAVALGFLCAGFAAGRYTSFFAPEAAAEAVAFNEPLIEEAARAQLGKSEGEPMTAAELETIRALYIFGTEVAATREPFENRSTENAPRGDIVSLDDLKLMPNIEELLIAYQDLEDISGIVGLKNPVSISFAHTRVSDVSALSDQKSLLSLSLYGTNVSDVSCLDACGRLEYLELGRTLVTSPDAFGGAGTVTELSLIGLRFDTLDGIERFTYLETLNLSNAEIGSVDALKKLPSLSVVYAGGTLVERLAELFAGTDVSVVVG